MSMGIKTVRWLHKIIKKKNVNVRKRKLPQCLFRVAVNGVTGQTEQTRETLTKSNGK